MTDVQKDIPEATKARAEAEERRKLEQEAKAPRKSAVRWSEPVRFGDWKRAVSLSTSGAV